MWLVTGRCVMSPPSCSHAAVKEAAGPPGPCCPHSEPCLGSRHRSQPDRSRRGRAGSSSGLHRAHGARGGTGDRGVLAAPSRASRLLVQPRPDVCASAFRTAWHCCFPSSRQEPSSGCCNHIGITPLSLLLWGELPTQDRHI